MIERELIVGPMRESEQDIFYVADKNGKTIAELPVEELWSYSGDSMRHKPEDQEEGEQ